MLDLLAATSDGFDVASATRAYLDTLQGPARAQSDAYFEGGYWLPLWGTAIGVLVDWLFLRFRIAHALRAFGERVSKRAWIVTAITAFFYTLIGTLVTLPWTIYTGYTREKRYDLLDQTFGAWAGEQAIGIAMALVLMPLAVVAIYALIRRAPHSWWLWSTGVIGLFMLFAMVLGPVFIAPLFNEYTELEDGPLRDRIEAVAAQYEIPAEHIYVFDQSKQHKRISANVSGLGPTIRISLNDNLLERTSEEEILAVMGHEMGHYKLHHTWWIVGILLSLFALGLFVTSRVAPALIRRYGERWGVRDMGDPASLPVLAICLGIWMFLMTPATNSLIRWAESKADAFGLDAAREPDGFAKVAMRLSEYRKIEPGPLEEFVFFDHPSGATRVRMAMRWKADNVENPQVVVPEEGYLDAK
ncbi:MAG: M48 family metallopeptidase [Erythrobacter sp.]|jgi:STE24 endopeptidase|uniref:M48 family metallopeptidase n=1 Tax=Qipengyuania citrea TaxID=225971 RepID=UPI0020A0E7AB|nr:M48 family metallopeptidase [Qipengyuania citrea]MCP2017979.1 STE24 endopeptidase [Qipengyuania citrea]MDE0902087.1 M48 family metallopeptidase [Erythrobacter sp.]